MPRIVSILTALAIPLASWGDTIIDGFTDETNDRFTNNSAFIADAYNLSGIGRSGLRWGTLVSSNVIISANHFHPKIGESIIFYATNDPAGSTESRIVVAGERFGLTDMWVGVLNSPLPSNYEPLAFTTDSINSAGQFNLSSHKGATVFMAGVSPTSPNVALDMTVGKNKLTDWQSNVTVVDINGNNITGNAIRAYQDLSSDLNYVTYEAFLQDQDSGAPMLRDINGELTIIGLNWYIGQVSTFFGTRNFSAFSYVGNFATQIQAIIDTYNGISISKDYGTWQSTSFGGETDLTLMAPDYDYDNDGLSNYREYALVYDPVTPDNGPATSLDIIEITGNQYGEITLHLQEADNNLGYSIMTGSDLSGWSSTPLSFNSVWGTGNTNIATVVSAIDNGSTWTVTIRDATPITAGVPRFIRIGYQ